MEGHQVPVVCSEDICNSCTQFLCNWMLLVRSLFFVVALLDQATVLLLWLQGGVWFLRQLQPKDDIRPGGLFKGELSCHALPAD